MRKRGLATLERIVREKNNHSEKERERDSVRQREEFEETGVYSGCRA